MDQRDVLSWLSHHKIMLAPDFLSVPHHARIFFFPLGKIGRKAHPDNPLSLIAWSHELSGKNGHAGTNSRPCVAVFIILPVLGP